MKKIFVFKFIGKFIYEKFFPMVSYFTILFILNINEKNSLERINKKLQLKIQIFEQQNE